MSTSLAKQNTQQICAEAISTCCQFVKDLPDLRWGWPSRLIAQGVAFLADEIDAIGTKRYESQSGGEREIQRTMLELLNQMDGFDSMGDVKVKANPELCHDNDPFS